MLTHRDVSDGNAVTLLKGRLALNIPTCRITSSQIIDDLMIDRFAVPLG